ncbi:MAG TPA: PilZ domain-containing protein [bacterium]
MSSHKRESRRFDFKTIVQVDPLPLTHSEKDLGSLKPPLSLTAKNFSQGGLCLETEDFFMPNQIVQLDFQLAKSSPVHTFAIVMWAEKKCCGLQFIKPESGLKTILEKWVAQTT